MLPHFFLILLGSFFRILLRTESLPAILPHFKMSLNETLFSLKKVNSKLTDVASSL